MLSAICFYLDQSKILSSGNGFTKQSQLLTTQKKKTLENNVGQGENAGNQHFLLFPHFLLLCRSKKSSF